MKVNSLYSYLSIPLELRERKQWVVAAPDKCPYTPWRKKASPTNPDDWTDFESVVKQAEAWGGGIGFVLSNSDPYAVIDLDVKDAESINSKTGKHYDPSLWTTQDELDRYSKIVEVFASYTELSRSGKGVHIWVKGKLDKGYRRDGVEMYSRDRFMICTGRVISNVKYTVDTSGVVHLERI